MGCNKYPEKVFHFFFNQVKNCLLIHETVKLNGQGITLIRKVCHFGIYSFHLNLMSSLYCTLLLLYSNASSSRLFFFLPLYNPCSYSITHIYNPKYITTLI